MTWQPEFVPSTSYSRNCRTRRAADFSAWTNQAGRNASPTEWPGTCSSSVPPRAQIYTQKSGTPGQGGNDSTALRKTFTSFLRPTGGSRLAVLFDFDGTRLCVFDLGQFQGKHSVLRFRRNLALVDLAGKPEAPGVMADIIPAGGALGAYSDRDDPRRSKRHFRRLRSHYP